MCSRLTCLEEADLYCTSCLLATTMFESSLLLFVFQSCFDHEFVAGESLGQASFYVIVIICIQDTFLIVNLWQGNPWDRRWTEPLQSASSYQRGTPPTLGHPSRTHGQPPSPAPPHPLQTRTKGRARFRRRQKPMGMLTSRLRRLQLALHRLGMSRPMLLILPFHLLHRTLEDLQVDCLTHMHAHSFMRTHMHAGNTPMSRWRAALSVERVLGWSAHCMLLHIGTTHLS